MNFNTFFEFYFKQFFLAGLLLIWSGAAYTVYFVHQLHKIKEITTKIKAKIVFSVASLINLRYFNTNSFFPLLRADIRTHVIFVF